MTSKTRCSFFLLLPLLLPGCHSTIRPADCGVSSKTSIEFSDDLLQGHRGRLTTSAHIALAVSHGDSVHLVISTPAGTWGAELSYLATDDNAVTWNHINADTNGVSTTAPPTSPELRGSPKTTLYRSQQFADFNAYSRSDDGGRTWIKPKYEFDPKSDAELDEWRKQGVTPSVSIKAIDPQKSTTIFATILGTSRLFVSRDGGDSWAVLSQSVNEHFPVAISPSAPHIMYCFNRDRFLLRSDDFGQTWKPTSPDSFSTQFPNLSYKPGGAFEALNVSTSRPFAVSDIVVDPANAERIFLVAEVGLLESADAGKSWRIVGPIYKELNAVNSFYIAELPSKAAFLGTEHGLFISDDRACNFRRIFPN